MGPAYRTRPALEVAADETFEPDNAVARDEAVRAAVSRFLELAPVQRSCVVLKDVFDYSLDEIAAMLKLSVSAIKSALVRGVRAMLVDEVKLELISRLKCTGRMQVSSYLSNYDSISGWNLVPGWLEDREILAVFPHPHDTRPGYFVELTVVDGRVTAIRDFRYVPYIGREAAVELSRSSPIGL